MNIYPALRGTMGRWTYFMVKMSMRELAQNVKFASDVYEDRTLDDAIQRVLNESRVKREIVTYLQRQQDRFFSSIVVAALDGNPKWYGIEIADDERFQIFIDDDRMNSSFGVLRFDGTQTYYALDGQHRLMAIKSLVEDEWQDAPEGFSDEEVSVLVVTPNSAESRVEFLRRYRRLFGNLNRYAKSMDQVTNIIMDEDDLFAILTRRVITDHAFFSAPGRQFESPKIKTKKGKNLRSNDPYFTSLETLYAMNETLLASQRRLNDGEGGGWSDLKMFKRFRPDDDAIDQYYEELAGIWDALLRVLPELQEDPTSMRNHIEEDGTKDSILFWPITQELIAQLARRLLDRNPAQSPETALQPLSSIETSLHQAPWRHLVLVPDTRGGWRMRSEDRKAALEVATRILWWQLGLAPLGRDEVAELRETWAGMLVPRSDEIESRMWNEIEVKAVAAT